MARTPESKAKKKVDDLLKAHDVYYITPTTGGYGASGAPDRVGCCRGMFFGVEVKADTELTPLQTLHLRRIKFAGGEAFVVRVRSNGETSGLEALEIFLRG